MFEKIKEVIVTNPRLLEIQNSEVFFFQKAQDALKCWIELKINDTQKSDLLTLSADYSNFLKINATFHPELIEIQQLIFKIISYCDEKAKGKKEFNEYIDFRVIARAGLYMGMWLKSLMDIKYHPENVNGSAKNAFNYLLEPENNSTILSENHRALIVNHYLNKAYEQDKFNEDLLSIFNQFALNVKNPANYTYYLSSLIYSYDFEWKPKKTISFKEFSTQLNNYFIENNLEFKFVPDKVKSNFIWIADNQNVIGNIVAHYEIYRENKKTNEFFVDLHFESKKKANKDIFKNKIIDLPEDLNWLDWQKSNSIRYNEFFSLEDSDTLIENVALALETIDSTVGDQVRAILQQIEEYKAISTENNKTDKMETAVNQILFGPPGTGKTYNSINEALLIVDPKFMDDVSVILDTEKKRKAITDRFKELLIKNTKENKGQIAFCTFHQSFSYEDFVEGIKPKTTDDKKVYYDIEPGVFLNICELANSSTSAVKVKNEGKISMTEEQFRRASFYKISLGEAKNPNDKEIYEFCRDNGYIAIGFGQENDFSGLSESEITEKCKELDLEPIAANQMYTFIHYLKKGNYVMISYGNKYIRALGKVVGDYEYWENSPIRYNHFRKVEWIFTDELIPIDEIYERGLSQKTMYKIDESALRMIFFTADGQKSETEVTDQEEKNYVLIIDEINRGNVSSIFGELITLIEKDKRSGAVEELSVLLPYSKKEFKVPKNVYLIGTMNTADKSIEALDTALRRRFSFIEKAPNPELLLSEGALKATQGKIDQIDVVKLLTTINNRLEKLIDKDHKIGHSYFMGIATPEGLRKVFKDKVIPLLEEYFFGDLGKIGLVLGESFIKKSKNDEVKFAKFTDYDPTVTYDLEERAVYLISPENSWNFESIYDDKVTLSNVE